MAFSEKQLEYIQHADKRWNIKTGATRSGKTYLDFSYVIPKRIRARIGQDGLVVILGVTKSTIERNVLSPMRNMYGDAFVGTINSNNMCYLFGEWAYCLGAEKVSQVSKIRGSSIKYCYGDEVADWSEEVFDLLKSRLDKPYSCFDGALNPQSPSHWMKQFIDDPGIDIYCQKYTIFDNPFLSEDFVRNLCREYEGSVYYKRYILGEWAIAEGLVYGMFSTSKHTFTGAVPVKNDCGYWISVDYGTMNPFAACLMEMNFSNGKVRVLKTKRYSGREQGETVDNEVYYKMLLELAEGYPVQAIVIDPSAAGMKATIKKYGLFPIKDGDNDVNNGIQEVTKYINAGLFEVHESCADVIHEFESYSWDDKTVEDRVIKENDHFMDAIRYFVYTIARRYNKGRI